MFNKMDFTICLTNANYWEELKPGFAQLKEKYGRCTPEDHQYVCEFSLPKEMDLLRQFESDLASFQMLTNDPLTGSNHFVIYKRIKVCYTKADYNKAMFFQLRFRRIAMIGGENDPTNKWFDGCCDKYYQYSPKWPCFFKSQREDLWMTKSEVKKIRSGATTDVSHQVIPLELYNHLIQTGFSSEDFRPVWDMKKHDIVCYQLAPKHILAPIKEYNHWTEETDICGYCHASTLSEDIDYERPLSIPQFILETASATNRTAETFGVFATPRIIINRSMYEAMREFCENRHFEPVQVLEKD